MCCFLFQRVVSSALLVSREPVNFSSKVCGEDFAWILFGRMCFLEGNISKFRCINLNLTLSLPPRIGQPKIEYPLFSLQGWPKLTTKRPRCAKMEREFVPSNGPKIICILKVGWDLGQTCPNKKIPGDLGWGWVVGASFGRYVMAAVGHPFFMIRWWKIWTHRYFNGGSFPPPPNRNHGRLWPKLIYII